MLDIYGSDSKYGVLNINILNTESIRVLLENSPMSRVSCVGTVTRMTIWFTDSVLSYISGREGENSVERTAPWWRKGSLVSSARLRTIPLQLAPIFSTLSVTNPILILIFDFQLINLTVWSSWQDENVIAFRDIKPSAFQYSFFNILLYF